jgi:cyclopropane-fatty-acyl-phospholipid synthase
VAVRFWDGSLLPGRDKGSDLPTVVVRSPRALAALVREPSQLGLARAWASGLVDVEGDLEEALRRGFLAFRDEPWRPSWAQRLRLAAAVARTVGVGALLADLTSAGRHPLEARVRGRRRSLRRDRAAVRHHYDVSNDFYRLILGPTMVYSCAYFERDDEPLESAQERKLDLVCRKLALAPGERFLDIGCGWGSLVVHAASRYGARALGITLSEPQAELARESAREAGVADRCEILVADYRELRRGEFDKVASIGMYEHVGRERLGEYVRRVRDLLRPGGLFLTGSPGCARSIPGPTLSSAATSSPTAISTRSGTWFVSSSRPISSWSTSSRCASTIPSPCDAGAQT